MTKKEKNKVIILGSGTSTGIPILGCHCSVCCSPLKKNSRLRTSIFLQTKKKSALIVDTTPDMRTQLLQNKISHLDAAIITHEHSDHLQGLDDLRPFTFFPHYHYIPVFTSSKGKKEITSRFPYIFKPHKVYFSSKTKQGGGIPLLKIKKVSLEKKNKIHRDSFRFFSLPHGNTKTLCFIHEKLGFITDCSHIPAKVITAFKKARLEILIIDCATRTPHRTHLHLEKTCAYIEKISAKFSGLIHMGHDFDHKILALQMKKTYGKSVAPLYDGQILYY
ncbi:MAG: MBL fold metallo-hydrolase [Bacteriovoracaceae bacterium]|nr:MBL fold metallo-hydrolase [Bacteriovoracaceae bacterium]